MNEEEDPVFEHPESYGIENLEAPGEPNREKMPPATPVPRTGRKVREEHMYRHKRESGHVPKERGRV